jgi:hypothetical protein
MYIFVKKFSNSQKYVCEIAAYFKSNPASVSHTVFGCSPFPISVCNFRATLFIA